MEAVKDSTAHIIRMASLFFLFSPPSYTYAIHLQQSEIIIFYFNKTSQILYSQAK